jgi:multidrug efflux system membrane fusion protein
LGWKTGDLVQETDSIAAPATGVGRIKIGRWLLGGGALIAVLAAYAYMNRIGPGAGQRGPRSTAAPVRIAVAESRDVAVVERTIGTVLANTAVQVSARVQGVIDAAHFQEGQFVKVGDLLFEIDPRPYQAALAQAKAQLAKDQAQLQNAENNEKRLRAVYEQKLTSVEALDAAVAATGSATASVAADQAAIDIAQLNLDYTRIRAPIAGKTGPMLVQPGNLVATNGTQQPLVTINQIQPIKVSFALPQSDLPRIQARAIAGGLVASVDQRSEGGSQYMARVDFVSNKVDETTGTIELRATFPNADSSLVPGQLVDVTVELGQIPAATVVPREAVNSGPDGLFAYVVNAQDRAEQRAVRVLFDDGASDAIEGDVKPDERVIIDGQLRVVPGAAVFVDTPKRKEAAAAESP